MRSIVIALATGLLALACHARFNLDAEVAIGPTDPPERRQPAELRLVTPIVIVEEGIERTAIAFPLKHTAITAQVGGMMAEYEIEQVFENPFAEPIEAVYTFPLGHTGAINGYTMIIGERTIAGEIQKRADARATYEEAKRQGNTAALVEQDKPNVFTQRIANIAPGETVRVKLSYVDLLAHRDGAYEMVVPLVVGPRYLPSDHLGTNPVGAHRAGYPAPSGITSVGYIDERMPGSTVSFEAEIDAGVPIQRISSGSHDIAVETVSPTRSRVVLGRADEIPNRDLRIKYTTAGATDAAALLAHKQGSDGYFVLAIQPKAQIRPEEITGREVMIVIDTSGSMEGEPLKQAITLASTIVRSLGPRDSFNILRFASGVGAMSSRMRSGDDQGKQDGLRYLSKLTAGGGTDMKLGIVEMLTREPDDGRVRLIYFVTDGFIGNDDVVVGAAHELLGSNRIFTVGIGSAPNRALLDSLADVGRGFSTYVALDDNGVRTGRELVRRSGQPYLTDIKVDWGGLPVTQLDPLLVPDLYAGLPLVISGRYARPGRGTIAIHGNIAGRRVSIPVEVELPETNDLPPIASLWARRRIEQLSRPSDLPAPFVEKTITDLGLQFHLMTAYTSFVAVDRTRVVSNGETRVVAQPAIIPEGVNPNTAAPGKGFQPEGSWRENANRQRSYRGGGGGGGGGRWFGSGDSVSTAVTPFSIGMLVALLWLLSRRFLFRGRRVS
jgi:Ca-activated chloride channel family protein